MKSGTTWIILGLAIVLGVIVFWVDRSPVPIVKPQAQEEVLFPKWDWKSVSSIDFFYTTNKFVHLSCSNGQWNLQAPLLYPAKEKCVSALAASLGTVKARVSMSGEELQRTGRSPGEFGISSFTRTLIVLHGDDRVEIRFGNKTVGEDAVFFQVVGKDAIYMTDYRFFEQIPPDVDDWRDRRVILLDNQNVQQISFQAPRPYGFELVRRNDVPEWWNVEKPTPAKADETKVEGLLSIFNDWQIEKFVADDPKELDEKFGLNNPMAEVAFSAGEQNRVVAQFGNVDVTDTNLAYVRLVAPGRTNIVLAKGDFLHNLMVPWQAFRGEFLWNTSTNNINAITFINPQQGNGFRLRADTLTGQWQAVGFGTNTLSGDTAYPVDKEVLDWTFQQISETTMTEVAKDIVTDYAPYGLDVPFLSIQVDSVGKNKTTLPVQQIDFGFPKGENAEKEVFARRLELTDGNITPSSDAAVLKVDAQDALKFPTEAFQMFPRDIMSFGTNDFVQVIFSLKERTRTVQRGQNGKPYEIVGYDGALPEEFLVLFDELIYRLGSLRAESWIYLGKDLPPEFQVAEAQRAIQLQYLTTGKIDECTLHFGNLKLEERPVCVVKKGDKWWGFKFPPAVYEYYLDVLAILLGGGVENG